MPSSRAALRRRWPKATSYRSPFDGFRRTQNRDVLAMLTNNLAESGATFCSSVASIRSRTNELSIRDGSSSTITCPSISLCSISSARLTFSEMPPSDCEMPHESARLLDRSLHSEKWTRSLEGNRRPLLVRRGGFGNGSVECYFTRHYFRPQTCLISPSISPLTRSSASIARS